MTHTSLTPDLAPGLDPNDLLVYAPGLQSLAARLVGVDRAEDLLQDTWVRALEKPPKAQQPLGPWLVRVLSNLAVSSYRKRSLRSDWECDLHESQQHLTRLPAPDEIGAELEAAETVMGAVSELEELPRKIISLRYLRGMASGQIGEALELPASTVRWHIQNSVAKMRVTLAKEGRDLSDGWVACLVPLIQMTDRAAIAKLGTQLSVKLGPQLGAGSATGLGAKAGAAAAMAPFVAPALLASVLAAFIGVLAQLFIGPGTADSLQAPLRTAMLESAAPSVAAFQGEPSEALSTPALAAAESSREIAMGQAVATASTATIAEETEAPVPHSPTDRHREGRDLGSEERRVEVQFCGRVVGEDQSPLFGAEAAFSAALGGGSGGFAVADSDGQLNLSLLGTPGMMGLSAGLEVSAPGHAGRLVTWPRWVGDYVQFGEIDLVQSRSLSGFVGDTKGKPIAGAAVMAATTDGQNESAPVYTDDKGRFKLPEVPRKNARVTAKIDGYQTAAIHPVDDFKGQLDLQLKRVVSAPTLALLVLDPAGLPVADAVVSLRRAAHSKVMFVTDKKGQLRVPLSISPGASRESCSTGDLTVFDPAFLYAPTRRDSVALNGQQHVLTLEKGRVLKFRVKNPDGLQVTGFEWFHPESIDHPSATIRHGSVDGSVELSLGVADDHATRGTQEGIVVLAPGFAPVKYAFRNARNDSKPIELSLTREETVEVRLMHNGAPVMNAIVTVTPTGAGPLTYDSATPLLGTERNTGRRRYRTDAAGAFHIPENAYQPLTLRVNGAGLAPWFHHHSGTGAPIALSTIELETGGTLVGYIPPSFLNAAGSTAPVRRTLEATDEFGSVEAISFGAAPFFQMHGLTPGRWTLRWLEQGLAGESVEVKDSLRRFEIIEGIVTYLDR